MKGNSILIAKRSLATALLMICVFTNFNAQTVKTSAKVEKVKTDNYYYTFSGENQATIDAAKSEIAALKNVMKVTLNFKAEKKQGQFIIVVQEGKRTSEGEELFSIKWVKEILENKGLTPIEFTYE